MSRLTHIGKLYSDAAKVLEEADFTSDSDLQSLDQTDLHELFPGLHNLKKRHDLFGIINQKSGATFSRPEVLEKIKEFNSVAARVLEDKLYRDHLGFLVRTDLLELFPGVKNLKLRKKILEIIQLQNSAVLRKQPDLGTVIKMFFKGSQDILNHMKVQFQKLDNGEPLKVSKTVIKKVTCKNGVSFIETTRDHKVSLLFCPVMSRIQSDAEAAIACIKDDKPVILVFLIHALKPQSICLLRSWDDSKNIVLHVYIFYHETKSGLLECKENSKALSDIEKKLLEYGEKIRGDEVGIASGESS